MKEIKTQKTIVETKYECELCRKLHYYSGSVIACSSCGRAICASCARIFEINQEIIKDYDSLVSDTYEEYCYCEDCENKYSQKEYNKEVEKFVKEFNKSLKKLNKKYKLDKV